MRSMRDHAETRLISLPCYCRQVESPVGKDEPASLWSQIDRPVSFPRGLSFWTGYPEAMHPHLAEFQTPHGLAERYLVAVSAN